MLPLIILIAFEKMEEFGWKNFDMKNVPGNSALMAANTMEKIVAMNEDDCKYFCNNNVFVIEL